MWDKKKTVNISTVSETFGIPASTLRYWESMGLISLNRRENNYREYTYSSLLDLSDICYLRNLGIPIKAIKEYQTLSLADSNALYLKKKSELEAQISSLQGTYSMLRKTLSLMEELEYIREHPFTESQPDVPLLLSHSKLYDKDVWKKYFSGQYQFAGVCMGLRITDGSGDGLPIPVGRMKNLPGLWRKETATLRSSFCALTRQIVRIVIWTKPLTT